MFGVLLETAIGLIFVFFLLSVVASGLLEAARGALNRRSKNLWKSLGYLLDNTKRPDGASLTAGLYDTPFVRQVIPPRDRKKIDKKRNTSDGGAVASGAVKQYRKRGPQHIKKTAFANGLLAAAAPRPGSAGVDEVVAGIDEVVASVDEVVTGFDSAIQGLISAQPAASSALGSLRALAEADDATRSERSDAFAAAWEAVAEIGREAPEGWPTSLPEDVAAAVDDITALAPEAGDVIAVVEGYLRQITEADLAATLRANADLRTSLSRLVSAAAPDGEIDAGFAQVAAFAGEIDGPFGAQLQSIVKSAKGRIDEVRNGLESWFDEHMAAVSTWWEGHTRWWLFAIGVALAIGLNANAIGVTTTLYNDDARRQAIVAAAEDANCDTDENGELEATCVEALVEEAEDTLPLPIGWMCPNGDEANGEEACAIWDGMEGFWDGLEDGVNASEATVIAGWIITGIAVSAGSPFWYDLLGTMRAVRRREESSSE